MSFVPILVLVYTGYTNLPVKHLPGTVGTGILPGMVPTVADPTKNNFFLPTQILVQRGTMVTFFIFFMLHFAWYTMVGYSAHAMFMQTLCKMHILPLFRSCMVHYAGTIVYHYKIMAIVTATFTIHQVGLEGLRILPSLTYLCSVYTADSSRVIFITAV